MSAFPHLVGKVAEGRMGCGKPGGSGSRYQRSLMPATNVVFALSEAGDGFVASRTPSGLRPPSPAKLGKGFTPTAAHAFRKACLRSAYAVVRPKVACTIGSAPLASASDSS